MLYGGRGTEQDRFKIRVKHNHNLNWALADNSCSRAGKCCCKCECWAVGPMQGGKLPASLTCTSWGSYARTQPRAVQPEAAGLVSAPSV
eukprot:304528-Rhodomonas_salina.1